jgi:curved DNA-binding protein CbpA
MILNLSEPSSLYEVLDIKPDASPSEVREAYLRAKSAYNKDSVALYTLIDASERDAMLQRIEEAYTTLSDEDRRKEYDRRHGWLEPEDSFEAARAKVISIDRAPPMEQPDDNALVPPPTDIPVTTPPLAPPTPTPQPQAVPPRNLEALNLEIAREVEWKGAFLRKVRETRRISIEEMASITKVSKTYLLAIEEENFPKLPAPVFLRGFVGQMARVLRLPHDQVTSAYMARYYQGHPDKK